MVKPGAPPRCPKPGMSVNARHTCRLIIQRLQILVDTSEDQRCKTPGASSGSVPNRCPNWMLAFFACRFLADHIAWSSRKARSLKSAVVVSARWGTTREIKYHVLARGCPQCVVVSPLVSSLYVCPRHWCSNRRVGAGRDVTQARYSRRGVMGLASRPDARTSPSVRNHPGLSPIMASTEYGTPERTEQGQDPPTISRKIPITHRIPLWINKPTMSKMIPSVP
jgi:hypothetical protein